ncbi:MAG: hypothetical protein F6J90_40990 [Moorea sp. SIOASIH]|uniref:hypothetical protein n=1 Tax=Moorena sp. SIOASIH TaxID=2607817 RepID=UPI0013B7B63B|nr:hypothetical protein [Moorena sp. SIOASIH]NEO42363.1 hypothetical protein [Moorena sp. SIOASIH]
MGETTAVAHGGNPQDRAASPRPRCIAYSKAVRCSVPYAHKLIRDTLIAECLR